MSFKQDFDRVIEIMADGFLDFLLYMCYGLIVVCTAPIWIPIYLYRKLKRS